MRWVISLLFLPLLAAAQQPFGYHATWHYYYSAFGTYGFKKVSHNGDTTINGTTWLRFSVTGLSEIKTGPGPNDIIQDTNASWDDFFLSTRHDSVFYFDYQDNVKLLFDFTAGIGNSWQFANTYGGLGCYATPIATVVNQDFDTINGQALPFMKIENPMDTFMVNNQPFYMCASGYCLPDKIYYNIGTTWFSDLFKPSPNICNGNSLSLSYHVLRCFSNDNFSVNFTNKACDYWSLIGIEENKLPTVNIYPNPNNGLVFIDSENDILKTEVFAINGQKLLVYQNEKSIELPESKGLYLLQITFENGTVWVEKVIRQ